ncbi:MAG TPA: glycosyltransferase family 4 protein [Oscillatoriales cyanobacterium M59_W2019_021]|nr:MAG: glycosyltransferase family 1 protein [Cyanobacteria bacterium J055]HIK33817.1 glycosyltransferase family 4 protein [Oscillatoriales cyanobacterium M4454_W2019_049]HIK51597.1 glycosyltransferase family 4 protein [Oscillatoriales cyanobacterium M59_W2019_021]
MLVNLSFLIRQPTGISTYALNLLPFLKPIDPTLLVAESLTDYTCYPIPAGQTPDQGMKGHLRRLLWTQLSLPRIYRQLKANLLFSPLPEAPIFTRCRSIITVHDLIPLRFPGRFSPLTAYQQYYLPQVLHQSQHLVCDSVATANDAIDFLGIPAAKITPVPLAYDHHRFRPLNLPQGNYFFYIGRHQPYKNLHRTIAAFAALPRQFDCQLHIAGPRDRRYTPALQAQAAELGVGDRVQFMDYVDDEQLPILLNRAIALVFPSLWEGFGLPVLEAMACGTPVITSNLSSLPEVAEDAALLVDPYNVGAIAAAMQTVVTDSTARSHLRDRGLNRASQFSWRKTGQATVEVLQRYL